MWDHFYRAFLIFFWKKLIFEIGSHHGGPWTLIKMSVPLFQCGKWKWGQTMLRTRIKKGNTFSAKLVRVLCQSGCLFGIWKCGKTGAFQAGFRGCTTVGAEELWQWPKHLNHFLYSGGVPPSKLVLCSKNSLDIKLEDLAKPFLIILAYF